MQPPIFQRPHRRLLVTVIALEDRGAPGQDLTVVGDSHLGGGKGRAHGLEADVPVPVNCADPADLRLAVELFEVHSHGVKETEDIGSQSRTPCVRPADPAKAQLIL